MSNEVLNRNVSFKNNMHRRISDPMLYRFMCLFFVAFALIPLAGATVTDLQVSPVNPVVGDTIIISGTESGANEINAIASFTKVVTPSGGQYEYLVGSVEIPKGSKNFAVTAVGVNDLYVNVKLYGYIPLTIGKDASSGTATISQSNVPSGTHKIKIFGLAETGVSSVSLKITATQGIDIDPDGHFEYRYSTGSIPVGDFNLNVGGSTKTVTLRASSGDTDVVDDGGASGGGGGGASEEQAENIVVKETYPLNVYTDTPAICEFSEQENPLMSINFTSNKNVRSVPVLVEVLHDTSALVLEPAPNIVYKNVNILIGFAGFDENIESAAISFKVDKNWIDDNNIDRHSITLMHYDDALDIWEKVVTELIGENESEIYYQAFPSEFSPFAIVGKKYIDMALPEDPMPAASETTETISDPVTKVVASTPDTNVESTFVPASAEDTLATDNGIVDERIERKYIWIGLFAGIALLGFLKIRRVI